MLDQMMDKLFVISEHDAYHLKVENDAVPMSLLMEERQKGMSSDSNTLSIRSVDKYATEKLKEIKDNRESVLAEGKATKIVNYATIDNQAFEYTVYFVL